MLSPVYRTLVLLLLAGFPLGCASGGRVTPPTEELLTLPKEMADRFELQAAAAIPAVPASASAAPASLPSAKKEIQKRKQQNFKLTKPELSVILSYSKRYIYSRIIESKLIQDEFCVKYFWLENEEYAKDKEDTEICLQDILAWQQHLTEADLYTCHAFKARLPK